MIAKEQYNNYFYFLLATSVVVLLYVSTTLSISYKEALNVFVNTSVLTVLTNTSIYIFGQNDIALRLPFIIFYILTVLLMYKMTEGYYKYEKDRLLSITIFMILPGVLSASLLVNSAIIVTFFTLLYIFFYEKNKTHSYLLLLILLFIDNSFAILYLALFFFALKNRDKKLLIVTLILFSISMYIYGFDTQGKPKSYFLDTFAIYSTVFSPLLFIYFIYTIYRRGIKNDRTLTWYISTTALLLSLLFSFRQKIYIEDFAPYVVIALPFMLRSFYHSYRVRLPEFRKKHVISAALVIFMLLLNVFLTVINKPLYIVIQNPKKHFVYKYHYIKELAEELKRENVNYIYSDEKDLVLRLKFYGIKSGKDYFLTRKDSSNIRNTISVNYYGKEIYKINIIKEK